jgi:hypothetical protein
MMFSSWPRLPAPAEANEPLGCRDHLARVAWHLAFPIRSHGGCHGRFAPSSRLGLPGGWAIFLACVAASASPPM